MNGLAIEKPVEVRGSEKWREDYRKSAWRHGGCVIVQIEGRSFGQTKEWEENVLSGRKKHGEGFTGYQSCNLSDILLLENIMQQSIHWLT